MTLVTEKEEVPIDQSGFTVWPFVEKVYMARIESKAVLPTRKHQGDAGLDFYAFQDTLIKPGAIKAVRTGITLELPAHYFGLMKPKGGSDFDVWAGVVDPNYQGEILFKIHNPHNENITFLAGQPVGQMVIVPIIRPPVVEISIEEIHAKETDRGATGGILENDR
jgi:dUTP pyrophosphatase